MDLQAIKNENGEYKAYIIGEMGEEIDLLTKDVFTLAEAGAKKLTLHINTVGGWLVPALGLCSAIDHAQNQGMEVTAQIDFLALSAGALVSQACKNVVAYDYSKLMFHATQGVRGELKKSFDESLFNYLKGRTKKDEKYIKNLLKGDNWFTAKAAKKEGFVDKVTTATPKNKLTGEMLTIYNSLSFNNMEELQKLKNEVETLSVAKTTLEAKNQALTAENDTLKAENKALKDAKELDEATNFVEGLIEKGDALEESKELLIKNYLENKKVMTSTFAAKTSSNPANDFTPENVGSFEEKAAEYERRLNAGTLNEISNEKEDELKAAWLKKEENK